MKRSRIDLAVPSTALAVSAVCAAIGVQALSVPTFADDQKKCSPSKDVICNVTNVEDLVAIDGTPWVVGKLACGRHRQAGAPVPV